MFEAQPFAEHAGEHAGFEMFLVDVQVTCILHVLLIFVSSDAEKHPEIVQPDDAMLSAILMITRDVPL